MSHPLSDLSRKTAIQVTIASLLRVSELASIEYSSVNFLNFADSFTAFGRAFYVSIAEFSDTTR